MEALQRQGNAQSVSVHLSQPIPDDVKEALRTAWAEHRVNQAYDDLPDNLKRAIEGRSQVHDSSRNSAGVLRPGVKLPTRPEEVEGPTHPLVRVHPVSGKRALYLGRRRVWPSNYIVGMPTAESEALLDKLWAHATQEKYAWTHYWQAGDIILWDNRCCMHYRTEVDVNQRRIMHRTTIKGEVVQAPWQ